MSTPQWATLVRGLLFTPASSLKCGTDIQPGDLVIETSKFGPGDPGGVGWLLRKAGHSEWVIEPLDRPGAEQVWSNADFTAVPDRIAKNVRAAGDQRRGQS